MIVGGLLGFSLILWLIKKYKLEKKFFEDLLFWWVVGAIIGARIYYVIYAWEMYKDNWLDVFKIWQGGLAVHGIMLGGLITTFIYCRLKKKEFLLTADLVVTGLVTAQIVGRIGNYFNQEIFGLPTNLSWGIPIDLSFRPEQFMNSSFFHPTFIYESLGNILILCLLLFLHLRRFKKKEFQPGQIFFSYLILYSILRFSLELLRVDYSPIVFGVRWAQLLSGIIILTSIILISIRFARHRPLSS
ncbi:MAG: Prolipoprotein diacylglyceryl transferase [Parcubacteria group bacterium GW2011_GWC2_39_14]|nr:MAG: Prolipoprotein diacylglyceryl transferase [Parcubacteria group bacterium GW2011_GWC2_39_14]KKR55134.1 MAG: Prolipoprotein diacylglyceryl transferase [Parcubacteria group bacterium GW2011_GWA2_40_23]